MKKKKYKVVFYKGKVHKVGFHPYTKDDTVSEKFVEAVSKSDALMQVAEFYIVHRFISVERAK